MFELVSKFSPKGDQKRAIEELSEGIIKDNKRQISKSFKSSTTSFKTFLLQSPHFPCLK